MAIDLTKLNLNQTPVTIKPNQPGLVFNKPPTSNYPGLTGDVPIGTRFTPVPVTIKPNQPGLKQATPGLVGNVPSGTTFNTTPVNIKPNQPGLNNQGSSNNTPANLPSQESNQPSTFKAPPPLSFGESESLKKSSGLAGTAYNFTGMTTGEATQKSNEARKLMMDNQSSLTSGTFNAQTIAGVGKVAQDFQIKLDSIMKTPFSDTGSKETQKQSLVNSFANEFASKFSSLDDFTKSQQNPEFQKSVDSYVKAGGSLANIASKITSGVEGIQPSTDTASFLTNQSKLQNSSNVIRQIENPDGTTTNILSDGTSSTVTYKQNPDGSLTAQEVDNQEMYSSLLPETLIGQNEIARLAGISEDLKKLYFGTPEQLGLLNQIKVQAEEKKKIIEKKAQDEKSNIAAQAQYNIDKNNADVEIEQAKITQNRLNSKNYITGYLAKMGALNTSGAAPVAIASLDQKYDQQISELNNKLTFANRLIGIEMTKDINTIQNNFADKVQDINEDLTKTEGEIAKEIFKAKNTADSSIYQIMKSTAGDLAKEKDSYKKNAESANKSYATSYLMLVGKGFSQSRIPQILSASGVVDITKLTSSDMSILGPEPKGTGNSDVRFDSKATSTFFSNLPIDFRNSWETNYPTWAQPGNTVSRSQIQKDYNSWIKANPNGKIVDSSVSQANIDKGLNYLYSVGASEDEISRFKTDRKAQAFILSKVGE